MNRRILPIVVITALFLRGLVVSAQEMPISRMTALQLLRTQMGEPLASHTAYAPVMIDVGSATELASLRDAMVQGWFIPAGNAFYPEEPLLVDDALRWRLRASSAGDAVTGDDRTLLSPTVFAAAVMRLQQVGYSLSPAYKPGDLLSEKDAQMWFASPAKDATGTLASRTSSFTTHSVITESGNWFRLASADEVHVTSSLSVSSSQSSLAPISSAIGIVPVSADQKPFDPNLSVAPEPQEPQPQVTAPPASNDSRDAMPSVRGTDLEQYVSSKPFAITMPTLKIADLGIEHPADTLTQEDFLEPLSRGVGHLFAYPGDEGTILLYGHSSNYPWDVSGYAKIFRKINQLKVGERVYVTFGGVLHVYEVTGKESVPAGDLQSVSSSETEELVLYTCWPPDDITQRYLVRAVPVGEYRID